MSNLLAISSIVVGADFTPCSAVALGQAMRIAAWSGAKLHVVHVIDTTVVIEIEEALSPMQQGIRDGLVKDAERAWAEFAKCIPGAAGGQGCPSRCRSTTALWASCAAPARTRPTCS